MNRAGIARVVSVVAGTLIATAGLSAEKTEAPKRPKPAKSAEDTRPAKDVKPAADPRNVKDVKEAKGVVARFSQAMKLYDSGKFNDALFLFDRIHHAYPSHEPTTIQYAKTLYRLDRIPDSYNLFARVNPQYLDPETSYEYGYSFYTQNRFDGALFSFKRVPVDHPLYDLASYYGAMCAIKLKKYAEAEELLDKAVVLPDKLARSKSLYQRHVSSLRQLQEKSDLERATNDEKLRITNERTKAKNPPPPNGGANTQANTGNVPMPYVHNGFFGVDRFGKLKFNQTTQSSDLHGYSRKNYSSQSGTFLFSDGPIFPLPFKIDGNRQASVGGQVNLSVSNITTQGTQERLVANEDSQDIVRNLTERLPTTTTHAGDAGGNVWIETPLPSGWWIGTDGHLSFTYPNFERGQRYGVRGGTGHVGWMKDAPTSWKAELAGTYDLIVDSETEPVTSQTIGEGSVSVKTAYALGVTLSAKYIYYDYKLPLLPGPDASTSGTLKLKQEFPLGMALTLEGTAERQDNYIARDLASGASASADGQIMTGSAKFSASPFDWIAIAAKHTRSESKWSVHQADRVEAFKAATPNYTETTEFIGAIIFNF